MSFTDETSVFIVGGVRSFEDVNNEETKPYSEPFGSSSGVTDVVAGFIFGLDFVNSCLIFDDTWEPTVEEGYTSLSCSFSRLGESAMQLSVSVVQPPPSYTLTTLAAYTSTADNDYRDEGTLTMYDTDGTCTVPILIIDVVLADKIYIIEQIPTTLTIEMDQIYTPSLLLHSPFNWAMPDGLMYISSETWALEDISS